MKKIFFFLVALLTATTSFAQSKNSLLDCWTKQAAPLQNKYLELQYTEQKRELGHNMEPWQTTDYELKGNVWCNTTNFMQHDSLAYEDIVTTSKKQIGAGMLLLQDHGQDKIASATKKMLAEERLLTLRYSPVLWLQYFYTHQEEAAFIQEKNYSVYTLTADKTVFNLYIRETDQLLEKVVTKTYDPFFGDVLQTYTYHEFSTVDGLSAPKKITIEKMNGKFSDEVTVSKATIVSKAPALLTKPAAYALKEDKVVKPEVTVEKYNKNIYFLNLKHTDDRVLVVEFDKFLVIAEAPLNSNNGELIIKEAQKIAPGKPIRLFVYGHHHEHYLGGLRAFVHKGIPVLTTDENIPYLEYLVKAPHTMQPDSLELQPRPLITQRIESAKKIKDGNDYSMMIYWIGSSSAHTSDYLIYYFPQEKLVFEDDLLWIPTKGEAKKPNRRQVGFYRAVKELKLDVTTVVQSWPISNMNVKTIIPFSEIENSMGKK